MFLKLQLFAFLASASYLPRHLQTWSHKMLPTHSRGSWRGAAKSQKNLLLQLSSSRPASRDSFCRDSRPSSSRRSARDADVSASPSLHKQQQRVTTVSSEFAKNADLEQSLFETAVERINCLNWLEERVACLLQDAEQKQNVTREALMAEGEELFTRNSLIAAGEELREVLKSRRCLSGRSSSVSSAASVKLLQPQAQQQAVFNLERLGCPNRSAACSSDPYRISGASADPYRRTHRI